MQTLAERLAIYTNSLHYEDLPEDVIHEVKRRVIDSLGCALGAYNSEPVRIAMEVARPVESTYSASIFGTKKKTSPDLSAFANTARNAVFAAILAKHGMTGPSPIFEGEKGFMKLVSGYFELGDFGGKESHFKILDTYIKFYPAEYHSQSAIEAALKLKSEIGDIDTIESIEVRTFDACYEIIGSGAEKWNPKTRETADHSLPYCIAVALVDGKVELDQFSEERIKDLMLHKLMGKIKISRDAELNRQYPEAMPNLIEIITKNGRRFSKMITHPKGHPKNPITDKEVEAKFKTMADNILPPGQTDIILDKLWHLEYIKDMGEIIPLLFV